MSTVSSNEFESEKKLIPFLIVDCSSMSEISILMTPGYVSFSNIIVRWTIGTSNESPIKFHVDEFILMYDIVLGYGATMLQLPHLPLYSCDIEL